MKRWLLYAFIEQEEKILRSSDSDFRIAIVYSFVLGMNSTSMCAVLLYVFLVYGARSFLIEMIIMFICLISTITFRYMYVWQLTEQTISMWTLIVKEHCQFVLLNKNCKLFLPKKQTKSSRTRTIFYSLSKNFAVEILNNSSLFYSLFNK